MITKLGCILFLVSAFSAETRNKEICGATLTYSRCTDFSHSAMCSWNSNSLYDFAEIAHEEFRDHFKPESVSVPVHQSRMGRHCRRVFLRGQQGRFMDKWCYSGRRAK